MRFLTLGVCTFLLLLPGVSAQDKTEKETLVKPVQVWQGRFDPEARSDGRHTIDLLTDAKAFGVSWKIFRSGEKTPRINFDDHFAVLVICSCEGFFLNGLLIDERGEAKVAGFGFSKPVSMPTGRYYVLAIFPRDKVKSVDGVKMPPRK